MCRHFCATSVTPKRGKSEGKESFVTLPLLIVLLSKGFSSLSKFEDFSLISSSSSEWCWSKSWWPRAKRQMLLCRFHGEKHNRVFVIDHDARLTSWLMVSTMTLYQSVMMLSVSYWIKYSAPFRLFSWMNKHTRNASTTHTRKADDHPAQSWVVVKWPYLKNVFLAWFVLGCPANCSPFQINCEFWDYMICLALHNTNTFSITKQKWYTS